MWALKGHRSRGLDVLLSDGFNDIGSLLTLKRSKNRAPLVWEFHIDNLLGPFRNHRPKALESSFGDCKRFQASYGLKMTPEDLKEGDGILERMFDTISCPPTHQNRAPSPHLDTEVDVRNPR